MNILKTIIFFITHLFKKEKRLYSVHHIHPIRDWLFGLFATTLLVCTVALFSQHQFIYYRNIDTQDGIFSGTVITYDATTAQNAISLFSKRKDAFIAYQNAGDTTVFPATKKEVATTTPVVIQNDPEPTLIQETVSVFDGVVSTEIPVVAN